MIERHWDGIAAYSRSENKVSLGFVKGLNNKVRVIQRRAYGLRDEEYLQLKILTCMLKKYEFTHSIPRRPKQKIGSSTVYCLIIMLSLPIDIVNWTNMDGNQSG
jgi:transposase